MRLTFGDRLRHRCPLPAEQRAKQPFLLDMRGRRLLAPWPPKRMQSGDQERLEVLMAQLIEIEELPGPLCWVWPDREPEAIIGIGDGWLAAQRRDRACYRV
jgi:hypothetical protein